VLITEKIFLNAGHAMGITRLVEVGSHEPSLSLTFVKSNPSNFAVAFEANPYVYTHYAFKCVHDRLLFCNIAIGKQGPFAKFYIPGQSWRDGRKFLQRIDILLFKRYHTSLLKYHLVSQQGGSLKSHRFGADLKTINVPVICLSDFISWKDKTALWIDCESFNFEALQSADRLFIDNIVQLVVIESDQANSLKLGIFDQNITQYLEKVGFTKVFSDSQNNALFIPKDRKHEFDFDREFARAEAESATARLVRRRSTKIVRLMSLFRDVSHKF
jgi:hypothetical protein